MRRILFIVSKNFLGQGLAPAGRQSFIVMIFAKAAPLGDHALRRVGI